MVLALIQARMGSTRLPGKVLKPLAGRPVIDHVIKRVATAERVDDVMVVTSIDRNNLPLISRVTEQGIGIFVGSENDVLDRFWQAVRLTDADTIVRVTADCPIIDPAIIDRVIGLHQEEGFDYTSNIDPPTWPDGLDVEVVSRPVLEIAWREATTNPDREHVTPFVRRHRRRFTIGNLASDRDLSGFRWTLDEEADYRFLRAVFEEVGNDGAMFGLQQVLELLDRRPDISGINSGIERNAGSRPGESGGEK